MENQGAMEGAVTVVVVVPMLVVPTPLIPLREGPNKRTRSLTEIMVGQDVADA